MSDGGNKWKNDDQPKKTMVRFEGDLLDLYSISRAERIERYDAKATDGTSYGILIRFSTFPSEKEYFYATLEVREQKWMLLESKLNGKIKLI